MLGVLWELPWRARYLDRLFFAVTLIKRLSWKRKRIILMHSRLIDLSKRKLSLCAVDILVRDIDGYLLAVKAKGESITVHTWYFNL